MLFVKDESLVQINFITGEIQEFLIGVQTLFKIKAVALGCPHTVRHPVSVKIRRGVNPPPFYLPFSMTDSM